MVLATKVGQRRSFAVGLLLTIVTFGIYAIYWNYRAHNEVYRQFELAREARDEGMVWYVLGLTLQPLLVAYLWIFASNVHYVRARIGLPARTTPGRFVLLAGSGVAAWATAFVLTAIATLGLGEAATPEEVDAALANIGLAVLLLFLGGAVVIAIAYRMLQADINELWDAYDARIRYLARHPEELAVRPAWMDDLAPATQATLHSALRGEVQRLRARHPELRALPDLEALLARADAGDAEAREAAERLLGDLVTALHERAELLRLREERLSEHGRLLEGAAPDAPAPDAPGEPVTADLDERLALLDQALFARA